MPDGYCEHGPTLTLALKLEILKNATKKRSTRGRGEGASGDGP